MGRLSVWARAVAHVLVRTAEDLNDKELIELLLLLQQCDQEARRCISLAPRGFRSFFSLKWSHSRVGIQNSGDLVRLRQGGLTSSCWPLSSSYGASLKNAHMGRGSV